MHPEKSMFVASSIWLIFLRFLSHWEVFKILIKSDFCQRMYEGSLNKRGRIFEKSSHYACVGPYRCKILYKNSSVWMILRLICSYLNCSNFVNFQYFRIKFYTEV